MNDLIFDLILNKLMAFEYGKPWWKLVHRNMDALEDEIVWHGTFATGRSTTNYLNEQQGAQIAGVPGRTTLWESWIDRHRWARRPLNDFE